jgi:hypothetical protein
MMMEIKAHQVEVTNSRYRSLPRCSGSALGEAFTRVEGRLTGAARTSRFERLQN